MTDQAKKTIPIFFTIDDNFTYYLDCAIRSIMDNASREYDYKFYVLYENLPQEHIDTVVAAVTPPFSIEFIPMEKEFSEITNRPENRLRCDFFTMTSFFRIFIADMFPQYDKGIYIDSDVIVPGDISEMYEIELGDNILGACPDFSIRAVPPFVEYVDKAVGTPIEEYINSGILLMNLKKMRELHFSERFLDLMNTYHFDSVAPDQDYINAMSRGKIVYLDECWDAMPLVNAEKPPLENPKLIHFNLFRKPWCYDDIPYEEYFWKYAKQSPFYQDILDFKAAYSDEQKKADNETLDLMLENALKIMKQDVTFRKIMESGVPVRL